MTHDTTKLSSFLTADGAEDWRITSEGAVAFYRIRPEGVTVRVVTRGRLHVHDHSRSRAGACGNEIDIATVKFRDEGPPPDAL